MEMQHRPTLKTASSEYIDVAIEKVLVAPVDREVEVSLCRMDLCVTIKGVSFLLQTGLGILGNLLVLLAYAHIIYCERRLQPVDMILFHLAFANMMVLLTRGVPQTMTVFQLHNLLDDVGCKIVIYSYRIVRALSVCITCLLSVFQSLTIAPATSRWANLKTRLPKLILPSFVFLWLLNMAVCIAAPFFSVAPRNGTVPKFTLNLGFCHVNFQDQLSYVINGVAITGRDFIFVGLMVLASGYILLVLHRHSKQMKGIRSSDRHQSSTLESRAAKTVITLVILYVVFFGIDNIIWIYMLTVSSVPPVISDMRVFFSSCYVSLSPFFIISSNKKIKRRMSCASEEPEQQSPASEVSQVKLRTVTPLCAPASSNHCLWSLSSQECILAKKSLMQTVMALTQMHHSNVSN